MVCASVSSGTTVPADCRGRDRGAIGARSPAVVRRTAGVGNDRLIGRRLEIEQRERGGVGLELRRELEQNFVFVHRRVDRRHPARSIRVVEGVLDLARGDAEGGGLVAIDLHVNLRARDFEVARQILDPRQRFERLLYLA